MDIPFKRVINMNEVKFSTNVFESALYPLPEKIAEVLRSLPVCIKNAASEIRLRAGGPVALTCDRIFYISQNGEASALLPQSALIATEEDLYEVLCRLCGHSVYTRSEELRQGYVSMKNGHRAGVCGRFHSGFFKDVSSVNIRIAREVIGAAEPLYGLAERGVLIAGRPGSGKTTVLRDLVRNLSQSGRRISLVDTRGEIAAAAGGRATLDVGINTDVITGGEKAKGVEIALRTLFPEYIAFDEIGNSEELSAVSESFFSGAGIITTAHAASMEEIMSRPVTSRLIKLGVIDTVAILPPRIGDEMKIVRVKPSRKNA